MYRIRETGELKSQSEIIRANPNTSFPAVWTPELVDSLGLDSILETPAPEITRYQAALKNGVEQDSLGNWVWAWTVVDMDAEAIAALDAQQAASVRATRNQQLAESDWTQVADAPVDQSAWAAYRQALRDVTAQPGFPWDITWPVAP